MMTLNPSVTSPRIAGRCQGRTAPALLGAAMFAIAGCTAEGPAYGPPPQDAAAVVQAINNLAFEPGIVEIEAGETVEWRNTSLFTHTVTFEGAEPAAGDGTRSGKHELPPGQILRRTFETPGAYHYICEPHDWLGMEGSVIVAPRS